MLPVLLKLAAAGTAVLATSPMVSNPVKRNVGTLFDLCPFKQAISTSFTGKRHCALTGFLAKDDWAEAVGKCHRIVKSLLLFFPTKSSWVQETSIAWT